MAWLVREEGVKERVTLVTSLIKDKFKFEFEMVEQEKLLYYYNKICEIGHLLGVLPSLPSANTTRSTPTWGWPWSTSTCTSRGTPNTPSSPS